LRADGADSREDEMMAQAPGGPGGRIFISYRREDVGYPAGWLFLGWASGHCR
jgi:hypothetical protein